MIQLSKAAPTPPLVVERVSVKRRRRFVPGGSQERQESSPVQTRLNRTVGKSFGRKTGAGGLNVIYRPSSGGSGEEEGL